MITYFDKNREIHIGDDDKLIDINVDAFARAMLKLSFRAKRKRPPRRLPPIRKETR